MREFELLSRIFEANADLPASVTIPPGDDMAGVEIGGRTFLIAVDQVADGVHVNLAGTSLDRVAWKLVVRNLSDVAAMAARPLASVATACFPRGFGDARASALTEALRRHAAAFGCPLIGGDVSIWGQGLLLTMTVLADPAGVAPVRRDGARVGDGVFVTGRLGAAWDAEGGGPHLRAEPRVEVARALATTEGLALHAMIDISDGLAQDLGHVCRASNVAGELIEDRLPLRDGASVDNALFDGEDYELCFTASGEAPAEAAGVAVSRVGEIVASADGATGGAVSLIDAAGERRVLTGGGWEHKDRP